MASSSARRTRLLVALLLEGRVATEIVGLQRAAHSGDPDRIGPHITLVPPVNVRLELLEGALALVREAAGTSEPLELEFGPLRTFLPRAPVLYLSVGGNLEAIDVLRRRLDHPPLTSPEGRERRPFVPHVTLSNRLSPETASALEGLLDYRATLVATKLSLLEQQPEDTSRRWVEIAGTVLGASAVRQRGSAQVTVVLSERLDPIDEAVFTDEWAAYSRSAYRPAWEPDRPFAFVARDEHGRAGFATGENRGDTVVIDRLLVVASRRGVGIGSRLLEAVERLAREGRATRVRLLCAAESSAIAFYKERGFATSALLPQWREGRDVVVLERLLS